LQQLGGGGKAQDFTSLNFSPGPRIAPALVALDILTTAVQD
jgi:hypothetical protein